MHSHKHTCACKKNLFLLTKYHTASGCLAAQIHEFVLFYEITTEKYTSVMTGNKKKIRNINTPQSNTEDSKLDFSVATGNYDNDNDYIALPCVSLSDKENSDVLASSNIYATVSDKQTESLPTG
jgi:hypothetical protein